MKLWEQIEKERGWHRDLQYSKKKQLRDARDQSIRDTNVLISSYETTLRELIDMAMKYNIVCLDEGYEKSAQEARELIAKAEALLK